MEKDTGSFEDIARNKLAQAIDDLESADILLGADKYRAANYCKRDCSGNKNVFEYKIALQNNFSVW